MPILDPIIQYNLLNHINKTEQENPKQQTICFLINYLQIASQNINPSLNTVLASIQFKKDVKAHILSINDYLDINYTYNEKKTSFKDFYDQLRMNYQGKYKNDGKYIVLRSFNSIYKYYQLFVDNNQNHSWFLSDFPIAVLCIKVCNIDEICLRLIILEIDIMQACGFTLILCVDVDKESVNLSIPLFKEIIFNHKFSEIHINYNHIYGKRDILAITNMIIEKEFEFDNYFYIYCMYIKIMEINYDFQKNESYELNENMKLLKKMPRVKIIHFSNNIDKSLKKVDKITSIFTYCQNGFENKMIKVFLNDVPLYDSIDDEHNISDFNFIDTLSDNNFGFIKSDDFLYWKQTRVEITINHSKKGLITKYVDFDDIHLINPSFYVENQMCLANVILDDIYLITEIINKAEKKYEQSKNFKKQSCFSLFLNEHAKKLLLYVLYSYKKYDSTFRFTQSQIYVAYKAIMYCIQHQNSNRNHGFVYQVETGEGKSSIVIIVAAVLALSKKVVHVVSSNTYLVNRDYNKSVQFFKQLNLTSAPLLHDNEIPSFGIQKTELEKENFQTIFFNDQLFKNSMRMNFNVCGIETSNSSNKANIIFSTLINFESLYLYMMEKCPGRIKDYYKNCSLVIDEADLVLIDELPNGTILSKAMKSNGEDVLKFVYDSYMKKSSDEDDFTLCQKIYPFILNKWPECKDIKQKHILRMFQEIKLVNEDKEFTKGMKYSIEKITNTDDENLVNKKEIVPFNYDHTGLLERNKEFSGFIHQFIALKEKYNKPENDDIIVKSPSLNYLYISHPIYVELYNSICGLTGTIGKKTDKKILIDHYKLYTQKIPREKTRRFYEYPIILCKDENEKYEKIVNEIMSFHSLKLPVLAIFMKFTEIEIITEKLKSRPNFDVKYLNIYDGRDENIKPKENAGQKRAISLGTNVCGRGTHIETNHKYPLHVIVTFYTTNSRVMNQAFGRTARGDNSGTARIICLYSEFVKEIEDINEDDMNTSLDMLKYVNDAQTEFIKYYRDKGEWIFNLDIGKQNFDNKQLKSLKEVKINVNRIAAYNYKYPICMKIPTFLNIQAQKIFSLFNCPNCEYTWKLFQQYIREMIFESWSIFLDCVEKRFYSIDHNDRSSYEAYKHYFDRKKAKLIDQLNNYFPIESKKWDIIPTFMHIFTKISSKYFFIYYFLNSDANDFIDEKKTMKATIITHLGFEFRPYSLIDQSGARIADIGNMEQERHFIADPELKYIKKGSRFLSITEKIDSIFDSICRLLDNFIGKKLGLYLFLRRTLGGCEFGLCYDLDLQLSNSLEYINNLPNCLIDHDPLLVFSVNVRSLIPFLAGILILLFIFLIIITGKVSKIIFELTGVNIKAKGVSVAITITEKIFQKSVQIAVNKACEYLITVLNKNMESFKYSHPKIFKTFHFISE